MENRRYKDDEMKTIEIIFLLIIIILGVFNIYLASKTAFLGEDEAHYVHLGEQFSRGIFPSYTRTGGIVMTSPVVPLIYSLFNASLPIAKMITATFGFLTLLIVYLIGRKIDVYVGIFSVILLLLMPTFAHMSLLAYVDVPMAFFSALFIYFAMDVSSKKKAVLLGIIMGISYYVKVSSFFLTSIFFLYSIYLLVFKRKKEQFKLSALAFVIALAIITPLIIRNMLLYNYPFFVVFDFLLPASSYATGWIGPGTASTTILISSQYFLSVFGSIPIILGVLGCVWIYYKRKNPMSIKLSTIIFLLFLSLFLTMYFLGKINAEQRYLTIIFPQLALIGGYWLGELKNQTKYSVLILIPLIIFAFYSNISVGLATSESTRYPQNYIEALEWVGDNTQEDALIFTTYGGSVRAYANRDIIWIRITEFGDIMTTDDATYIHTILYKYNVSHIIIWRGVVAQSHIVPHANLVGVFSIQFVNAVLNAPEYFKIIYQNEDNVVLEIL